MTVIDEYGVTFTDCFERDGALYGYDVDSERLQVCADYEVAGGDPE
jgi:hypothetical protein